MTHGVDPVSGGLATKWRLHGGAKYETPSSPRAPAAAAAIQKAVVAAADCAYEAVSIFVVVDGFCRPI